jgi:hypothetical protein
VTLSGADRSEADLNLSFTTDEATQVDYFLLSCPESELFLGTGEALVRWSGARGRILEEVIN